MVSSQIFFHRVEMSNAGGTALKSEGESLRDVKACFLLHREWLEP